MDPYSAGIIYYIIVICLLLLGGAYFAACESAFASVNEIRLITLKEQGNKKAKIALKIKEDFSSALTTILILNNVMHIAVSSCATVLATRLGGNDIVAISTFLTTFVVFIVAEMIPKAYANDCNEKLALMLAPSLNIFIVIFKPLNTLFSFISNIISKLFNIKEEDDVTVSEEELFDIIENIDGEDKIQQDEAELVKSALELTVKTAKDIIIDINSVTKIDENQSLEEIKELVLNGDYTRLPVYENNMPIGVLQIRKCLLNILNNKKKLIYKKDLDPVVYIDDDKPIDELLDYMSENKTHFAFVRNKKNEIIGTLTIEDILEELVGEIYDEEEKEKVKL